MMGSWTRGDSDPSQVLSLHHKSRTSSGKAVDLEGELGEILRRRSANRSASGAGEPQGGRASRVSSLKDFNIFKKSITYDSQYKEYEEEVVFVEPVFNVKRIVSPQGEIMLSALAGVSRKIEIMAMLPEVMARLIYGDMDLERVLGEEVVDAILRVYYTQAYWIEYRNEGEDPILPSGVTLEELKKRLQKGARYPAPQSKGHHVILQQGSGNDEEMAGEDVALRPAVTASSIYSSTLPRTAAPSKISIRSRGYGDWVTPGDLGIPTERYLSDVVKAGYRQVFRLISSNPAIMTYLVAFIPPEVTQAVKVLYSQMQLLEGLMYVKFLMTPEEEIQRLQHLKHIWIREQRLLREYRALEEQYEEIGNNKERVMFELNQGINALIVQIDSISDYTRYEINKLSGEGKKQDLVNTKKFDQDLQQLDGNFQAALKFALKLRATYAEIENGWRQQRNALEADLQETIARYDTEMKARQQILDECLATEEANKVEIARLEEINRKVEKRYAQFKDETRVKKRRKKSSKKKKKSKGKKGKKKGRGRSKKKGGKSKSKSKSKSKKGKGKGSKGKKGKKGKKNRKSPRSETESEAEFGGEDSQYEDEMEGEGLSPKRAGKKRAKKSKNGKDKKSKKETDAAYSDKDGPKDFDHNRWLLGEDEEEMEGEGMWQEMAFAMQAQQKVKMAATSEQRKLGKKKSKSKKKSKKRKGSKKSKRKKKA